MKNYNACAEQYRPSVLNVIILTFLLLTITLFVSPHAQAASLDGSYHVIVNGRSIHLEQAGNGQKLNENNLGSGFQYEFARSYGSKWVPFITGSIFNDSFNNLSYYAGGGKSRRFFIKSGWHLDVGYVGFLMARKDVKNYQPFPGILPIASIGTRNIAINMTYIPDVNEQITELVFFQLKISM